MTTARWVGLVLVAAEVAVLAYVLLPLLRDYRRVCREHDRLRREWAELDATVEAARADFEDVRAAEREKIMDWISREELAKFFAEWDAEVGS